MNERTELDEAVREAIALLVELRAAQVPKDGAWERVRALRDRHPGCWINLVWEQETYGDRIHYDLLLGAADGTLSLSWCPDEDVPWPVRGLQRVNESLVLRVNDDPVRISQVITSLDYAWHTLHVGRHLVDMSLIDQEVREGRMEVSTAELEAALTAFRRRRRLLTAADLGRWMAEHGTTEEQLEIHLRGEATREKLRRRVIGGEEPVAAYFAAHERGFDRVQGARIHLADLDEADRLYAALSAEPESFLAVAQERFLAGGAGGELFSTLERGELAPEAADVLFATAPGEVSPPLPSGDGYELVRVLRHLPAALDAATRERIGDRLFEEWLHGQRETARVEWFWGAAEAAEVPALAL